MSVVFLFRHARALAAGSGMVDRDRPLAEAGRREARSIGAAMVQRDWRPSLVICSSAQRTRETLQAMGVVDDDAAAFTETLYSGDGDAYLAAIRSAGERASVMLVGHNPMIESTAAALAGTREPDAARRLAAGFPTAGLAMIRFSCPLAEIAPGGGHLEEFLTPTAA